MEPVTIKTRRIKSGKYAADGEYTGHAYTIVRKSSWRDDWWYIMVGYGSNKRRLYENSKRSFVRDAFKTKREAVEKVEKVETTAKAAKLARDMGLEVEKKVKVLSGKMVMGGLIGGRKWTMLTRLRINGDPITDWDDGMKAIPKEDGDIYERLSRMCNGKVDPLIIKGLVDTNYDEAREASERRNTIPSWTGSGGSGLPGERHWILD